LLFQKLEVIASDFNFQFIYTHPLLLLDKKAFSTNVALSMPAYGLFSVE